MKLSILPLALAAPLALALPHNHIPEFLAEVKQRQSTQTKAHLTQEHDDIQTLYLTQTLDHFTEEDSGTFQQKYFYTNRHVHTNGQGNNKSAAFLCVGGEGPSLTTSVLVDSVHCTGDMLALAEKLFHEGWDVHLFALEHRYYGDSFPIVGDGDEDAMPDYELTHLSSRQAVRDVIQFVQSSEVANHVGDSNVEWITFGGSYPGMLSAWSRLLFPSVIHGAVSSSAPVQPELDFWQYYGHVGKDLGNIDVGGSEECQTIFIRGHQEIVDALEGKSFPDQEEAGDDVIEYFAEMFNVCDGPDLLRESKRNIEILIGDGVIRVPSQENDPSCDEDLCNIQKLCDAIIQESKATPKKSSMQILASIINLKHGDECSDVDWQDYIDYYSDPNPMNANDRSWLYQTCTEFGFYQTCSVDSDCPYAKGYHTVDRDLEMCQKVFGISPEDVPVSIQSTLDYYGGWNLTPSAEAMDSSTSASGPHLLSGDSEQRIVFVNGEIDPWSELAVSQQEGASNDHVISVEGASHHFWTHKIRDSDGEAIVAARQQIYDTVSSWLGVSASITAVE